MKEPKRKQQHNLGGVRLSEHQWERVRKRYEAQRRTDETFSAWVRRKLGAA